MLHKSGTTTAACLNFCRICCRYAERKRSTILNFDKRLVDALKKIQFRCSTKGRFVEKNNTEDFICCKKTY